jgi:hypothetical protein
VGIIDWDRARPDAPPGFDACHLAIAARALASGEQLGQIVRDLLLRPRWTSEEEAWLVGSGGLDRSPGGWPREPEAIRAMVGLAWLHHVSNNVEKSNSFAINRLWAASNIERVVQVFLKNCSKKEA